MVLISRVYASFGMPRNEKAYRRRTTCRSRFRNHCAQRRQGTEEVRRFSAARGFRYCPIWNCFARSGLALKAICRSNWHGRAQSLKKRPLRQPRNNSALPAIDYTIMPCYTWYLVYESTTGGIIMSMKATKYDEGLQKCETNAARDSFRGTSCDCSSVGRCGI